MNSPVASGTGWKAPAQEPPTPEYYGALGQLARPILARDLPDTLTPMRALLDALGQPQTAFPVIAVAGSVGKGTAALALARRLSESGRRVGLYTSPHLHSFRERFVIDGIPISPDEFIRHAGAVRTAADKNALMPSMFEAATALALLWFAQAPIDIAVCEIGLGGRFDAVNAADPAIALITPIEREHAIMLGGSLESIAWHKAGIMRRERPAFSVEQTDIVRAVLAKEAETIETSLTIAGNLVEAVALAGDAALALTADCPIARASAVWPERLPGRLEEINAAGKRILIDGCHTPLGAGRLRATLDAGGSEPARVLAAFLSDKSAIEILRHFDAPQFSITLAALEDHRAADAAQIARAFTPQAASVSLAGTLEHALAELPHVPESRIAIMGSLRAAALARETFGLVTGDLLAESRQTRALFASPGYLAQIRPSTHK